MRRARSICASMRASFGAHPLERRALVEEGEGVGGGHLHGGQRLVDLVHDRRRHLADGGQRRGLHGLALGRAAAGGLDSSDKALLAAVPGDAALEHVAADERPAGMAQGRGREGVTPARRERVAGRHRPAALPDRAAPGAVARVLGDQLGRAAVL